MIRLSSVSVCTALVTASLLLMGCGEQTVSQAAVIVGEDGVAEVRIGSDDHMRFDVRRFTVHSGQTIRLTLDHKGRMPLAQMGHNVVILSQDEDPVAFGREVMRQGGNLENQHLPDSMRDRVIAFTAMIGGGESDTIEFVAPPPGKYPFVCTFPGHYSIMRGVMIVE
jgi:azurin